VRKGLTREHLIAHGGVVDEDGFDDGGLAEIAESSVQPSREFPETSNDSMKTF
jgi:hypothetical protein